MKAAYLGCTLRAFSQDIFIRTDHPRSRVDRGAFFVAAFHYDLITLQARCKSRPAGERSMGYNRVERSLQWANTQ